MFQELTLLDLQSLGIGKEIIFIDGGLQDSMLEIAKTVSDVQIYQLSKKDGKGRGAVLRKGIKHAKGNVVLFFPSDDEYNVEDIELLLKIRKCQIFS